MVIGTDWSGERHAYGAEVVVLACVTPVGGEVSMVADGHGIRVRPRSAAIARSGNGLVPFHVTVDAGGSGSIRVQQRGEGVQGDAAGPLVTADGNGWHFAPHER